MWLEDITHFPSFKMSHAPGTSLHDPVYKLRPIVADALVDKINDCLLGWRIAKEGSKLITTAPRIARHLCDLYVEHNSIPPGSVCHTLCLEKDGVPHFLQEWGKIRRPSETPMSLGKCETSGEKIVMLKVWPEIQAAAKEYEERLKLVLSDRK